MSTTKRTLKTLAFVTLCGQFCVWAEGGEQSLRFANIFSDHMVLQREKPVRVWGWAEPGAQVSVVLTASEDEAVGLAGEDALKREAPKGRKPGDEYRVRLAYVEENAPLFSTIKQSARADQGGLWVLELDPLVASFKPKFLIATSGEERVAIRNVLIGEVWICAGQSNMAWSGNRSAWLDSEGLVEPAVRYARIGRGAWYQPKGDLESRAGWIECTEDILKNRKSVSTIPYLFGKFLHRRLKVPVGIINAAKGGSFGCEWATRTEMAKIEYAPVKELLASTATAAAKWETEEGRKRVLEEYEKEYAKQLEEWNAAVEKAKAEGQKPPKKPRRRPPGDARSGRLPGGLLNARVAPWGRLAVRGVLFLQGENQALGGQIPRYEYIFPAVITSFRQVFADQGLPFGVITLQGSGSTREGPELGAVDGYAIVRDMHYRTHLRTPGTGFICAHDVGGGLHPDWKRPLAERAVHWAAREVYHDEGIPSRALTPRVEFEGRKARVYLERETRVKVQKDGKAEWTTEIRPHMVWWPMTYNIHDYEGFVIAGADRRWYPAQVRTNLERKCLELSNALVPEPVAVRYGWNGYSLASIGSWHEPLPPFRTDDWPTMEMEPHPNPRVALFKRRNERLRQRLDRVIREGAVEASDAELELFSEPKGILLSRAKRMEAMLDSVAPSSFEAKAEEMSEDFLAKIPERWRRTETIWAKWSPWWNASYRLAMLPDEMAEALRNGQVAEKLAKLRHALKEFEAAVKALPDAKPLPEPIRPNPPPEWQ